MRDIRSRIQADVERPEDDHDPFALSTIREYVGFALRSPARHKVLFASLFVIVLAGALGLAAVLPRKYLIQATILAQRNPMMSTLTNPMLTRDTDAPVRAAREVVMRRENLVALCRQTHFVERHMASRAPIAEARAWLMQLLRGPPKPDEVLDGIVDGIEKKLWVFAGAEGTVNIGFTWSDPDLAYSFVNAAVQSYLEARHTAEVTSLGETIAILEVHVARVQREAQALAAKIDEKERALRGKSAPSRPIPVFSGLSDEDMEITRLEAKLAAKQQALASLEEFRRRRLEDLQQKLAEQLNTYAPRHPLVIETQQAIAGYGETSPQIEALQADVREVEGELKRRAPNRAGRTALSMPALDGTNASSLYADPQLDYERSQLAALVRQHANLRDRIDAARVEIDTAQAAFKYRYTVVSPPQLPRGPTRPYGLLFALTGVLGGLAFAVFGTTIADLRSGRIIERWQIERGNGIVVLAEIKR